MKKLPMTKTLKEREGNQMTALTCENQVNGMILPLGCLAWITHDL